MEFKLAFILIPFFLVFGAEIFALGFTTTKISDDNSYFQIVVRSSTGKSFFVSCDDGIDLMYCNDTTGSWTCDAQFNYVNCAPYEPSFDLAIDPDDNVWIYSIDAGGSNAMELCNSTDYASFTCRAIDAYVADMGALAMDSTGKAHMVQSLDLPAGEKAVNYSLYNPADNSLASAVIHSDTGGTVKREKCAIAIDSNDKPHIACDDGTNLAYTNKTGAAWGAFVTIPSKGGNSQVSMAIDLNDNLWITKQNVTETNYYPALVCNSSDFVAFTCKTPDPRVGSSFANPAIEVDGMGNVHMFYMNTTGIARYCNTTDGNSWNCESLGEFGDNDYEGMIGRSFALADGLEAGATSFTPNPYTVYPNLTDTVKPYLLNITDPVAMDADLTPPTISIIVPANNSQISYDASGRTQLNITFGETVASGTYNINSAGDVSTGAVAELNTTYDWGVGSWNISITAIDGSSNSNTTFVNFSIVQASTTCTNMINGTANTTGRIGYWKLDSFNSTNYTSDFSGRGKDAQGINFNKYPIETVAGQNGNGTRFDGVDDWVNVSGFSFGNSATMTAWFYLYNFTKWGKIVAFSWVSDGLIIMGDTEPGDATLQMGVANSTSVQCLRTLPNYYLKTDEWYFAAIVYDYDKGTIDTYINGTNATATYNCSSSYPYFKSDARPLLNLTDAIQIGGTSVSNATIDEVKAYDRPLSQSEISFLYNISRMTYYTKVTPQCAASIGDSIGGKLWRNGTDVTATENNTAMTYGAGTYEFICNRSSTQNYSSCTSTDYYTMGQTPATCANSFDLLSPQVYSKPISPSCLTSVENSAGGKLWRNGTDVTATENNTAMTYGAADYAFICNRTSTQNFSVCSDTDYFTVQRRPPVLSLSSDGLPGTSGLLGWWKLESFDGNNYTEDFSDNGYDGLGVGFNTYPIETVAGRSGNGTYFDKIDNQINISAPLLNRTDYTMSAWVKPAGTQNSLAIIYHGNNTGNLFGNEPEIYLAINNTRYFECANYNGTTCATCSLIARSTTQAEADTWYHVACVKDTNSIDSIKLYINGILEGSMTRNYTDAHFPTYWTTTFIGRPNYIADGRLWNGTINDVKIYSRALSQSEISVEFNSSISRIYPNMTNIQASESNSVDSGCTYVLARNGSAISSGAQNVGAAAYNFTYNTTGCANFTSAHSEIILNLGQNSTNPLTAWLNSSAGNMSCGYGCQVNASSVATYGAGAGTLNIFRNGSLLHSGSTFIQNQTLWPGGVHEFKFNLTGNENYTSNSTGLTFRSTISVAASTCSVLMNGSSSNRQYYKNQTINISCSCGNTQQTVILTGNHSIFSDSFDSDTDGSVENVTDIGLLWYPSYDNNNISCNCTANENYTFSGDHSLLNISADFILSLNSGVTFKFYGTNQNSSLIQPQGQNSTNGAICVNNTNPNLNSVGLNISLFTSVNTSQDYNVEIWADDDSAYAGATKLTNISASYYWIFTNLTYNDKTCLWLWANYNNSAVGVYVPKLRADSKRFR